LTSKYFPNDHQIDSKRNSLDMAIQWYTTTKGRPSWVYSADNMQSGVARHSVDLANPYKTFPYAVQIFFAEDPQRNSTSSFYPVDNGWNMTYTPAPLSVMVDKQSTHLAIPSAPHLYSVYNADANKFTPYDTGFWVLSVNTNIPKYDGGWKQVQSSTKAFSVTLISGIVGTPAFVAIWFGEGPEPAQAYPLVSRAAKPAQPKQADDNPVSISLVNGNLEISFSTGPVFSYWSIYQGIWFADTTGWFRGIAYTLPQGLNSSDLFDSGWVASPEKTSTLALQHKIGVTPELVQAWFSPTGSFGTSYPAIHGAVQYYTNPVYIRMNSNDIMLDILLHPNKVIFSAFTPTGWQQYSSGFWRIFAWKSASMLIN